MPFQIRYTDGEMEDVTETLHESVGFAKEIFNATPDVFALIDGIYTGSMKVLSRHDLDLRFDEESHAADDLDEKGQLDAYNFRNETTL